MTRREKVAAMSNQDLITLTGINLNDYEESTRGEMEEFREKIAIGALKDQELLAKRSGTATRVVGI